MNENKSFIKDEQSESAESVNQEPVTQEKTQPKKKNVLSKIVGISFGIVVVLAAVLIVFGFIHLGFDQEQAITEFIFALVGVVITVVMLLISPSASQRDTINAKNKTFIAVIGNAVCVIVLSIVVLIGALIGFSNVYDYRDEEHMTSNLSGIYECDGYNYLLHDYVIYKYDYEELFGYESLSDSEILSKFEGIDDLTIDEYISQKSDLMTKYVDISYDYNNATLTFEEGTIFVDRHGNKYLNGKYFARVKLAVGFKDLTDEWEMIQNKYSEAYSDAIYSTIDSPSEYAADLKSFFPVINKWKKIEEGLYTDTGKIDNFNGSFSVTDETVLLGLPEEDYEWTHEDGELTIHYTIEDRPSVSVFNYFVVPYLEDTLDYGLAAFSDYPGILTSSELIEEMNVDVNYNFEKTYNLTKDGIEYKLIYDFGDYTIFYVSTVESVE